MKTVLLIAAVLTAGVTSFSDSASALNFETPLAKCVLETIQDVGPPQSTRSVVMLTNGSKYNIPATATFDIQYSERQKVLKATKSYGVEIAKNGSFSEPNPFGSVHTTAIGSNCSAVAHWSNNLKPPVLPLHQP